MIKRILFFTFIFTFSNLYSQSYNMEAYFSVGIGHVSWVIYDYEYVEFNQNAYLDSSITLESFKGEMKVSVSNFIEISDTTKYILSISKKGKKVRTTFFDTLSVEDVDVKYMDSVFVVRGISELGGSSHIYGWIFPDTLLESVSDSLDSKIMYPYSRLYMNYDINSDSSWFRSTDTLSIHYRPKTTNYNDSYFAIDYFMVNYYDTLAYSRYYSHFGEGFSESYIYKSSNWAAVDNSKENYLTNSITLSQNYPNPFNPKTKIRFSTKKRSNIKLNIYDILGTKISTLIDDVKNSGEYEIEFDGSKLSSGVYFYRLISDDNAITKKFIILK